MDGPIARNGQGSRLVNRNVTVSGHRTSMRLEPEMWEALKEICRREGCTVHALCSLVEARRTACSLTSAIRVFVLEYFRAAVTEEGHALAGHGRADLPGYAAAGWARRAAPG